MFFTKGLEVFEASGRESGLDDLDPRLFIPNLLSDLFPFDHPGAADRVLCLISFHSSEACHVVPSLQLLEFGLVHLHSMLLDVFC